MTEDKREDGGRVGGGGAHTHLIDCWERFVRERWTEYERRNKVAACLSLLWRKSRRNGTENIHPVEEETRQSRMKRSKRDHRWEHVSKKSVTHWQHAWRTRSVNTAGALQSWWLYLFVEAAEVSVLPHTAQDLRRSLHHFRTMSGNSVERKESTYSIKLDCPLDWCYKHHSGGWRRNNHKIATLKQYVKHLLTAASWEETTKWAEWKSLCLVKFGT